jgi:hypothetical protein
MRGVLVGILLFSIHFCNAQGIKNDTIPRGNLADTLSQDSRPVETIESYAKRYDPRKAMLYAAVMPGAGQFYNKKYWKMPLVYGGFAGFLYGINFYQTDHLRFREELFDLINDPGVGGLSPSGLTEEQLRTLVDRTRRERDFLIILTGFFYILQMVDAHVDAHLKEFDLNPKLQVRIEPMMENDLLVGRNTGVAVRIRF